MRKYFILILCSLLSVVAFAAPVTKEQARQIASQFLTIKGGAHRAPAQLIEQAPVLNAVDKAGNPYIYAFNAGHDAGFVLVSGDDRFRDVLAYSASGNYDNDDMPAHVKAWLQGYVDEMKYYESIGYQPSAEAVASSNSHRAIKRAILPLLTTVWGQGNPYNLRCPEFFDENLSVTGCVATAMAQVVYYTAKHSNNQPTTLIDDIPGYTCSTNWSKDYSPNTYLEVKGIAKTDVTFDWNNMLETYRGVNYTDDQANAVATLMECCGKSVQMDYSSKLSSARNYDVAYALVKYFGFDKSTKSVSRSDYSYSDWIDLVYGELAAQRPVQYGGQSSGGGHSFVIDGYDGDEMFHVNWGWNGNPDSYYALSVLNPDDNSGIGASSSNDGYSYGQDAIVGVQIGSGQTYEETPVMLSVGNLRVNGQKVVFEAFNQTGATHTFDVGIGFMNENGEIASIEYSEQTVSNGYGWYNYDVPVSTDKQKADKTLKIVPISRESSTTTWYTGCNSDIHYYDAIYDADGNPTLTAHPNSSLTTSDITFTGDRYVNVTQPIDVTVTNTGEEFYGVLYLFASTTSDKGDAVNKGGVTVQKNKSTSMTFEWTPKTIGNFNIWIATDKEGENVIGTSSVVITVNANAPEGPFIISAINVSDVDETSWTVDADGNIQVDVYSTSVEISPTIKNISSSGYSGITPYFYLYKYEDSQWVEKCNRHGTQTITLNAGKEATYNKMNLGEYGYGKYKFVLKMDNDDSYKDERYVLNLIMGYTAIDESGAIVRLKANDTVVTVGEDVTAVDLSSFSYTAITPNSNPNTLYIIGSSQTAPESLNGKNVVKGGVAEQITLTDGYAFYSPVDFTANEISYTRTETTYYNKDTQKGWTTIVLPFSPAGIKTYVGKTRYDLEWFQSGEETNKNLWLMEFYDEHDGIVDFGYAGSTLEANKPYIMALPGDSYGNRWSLEGLPITFYATNAAIKANAKAATTGINYKFVGTTLQQSNLENIYKLNDDGDQFVKGTASIEPFRAYFAPTSSAATAEALSIGFRRSVITNVMEMEDVGEVKDVNDNNVYNLNGQRVSKPTKGLYIVNGRKVVIK